MVPAPTTPAERIGSGVAAATAGSGLAAARSAKNRWISECRVRFQLWLLI
jgi:hypothetical protein